MALRSIDRPHAGLMDVGLLVARATMCLILAYHGSQKLFGWFGGPGVAGAAGFFEKIGIPFPTASVIVAGSTEFFGSILLFLGVLARPAAALIAITMYVAAFGAHSGFDARNGGMEYPLSLALFATALTLTGPGRATALGMVSTRRSEPQAAAARA